MLKKVFIVMILSFTGVAFVALNALAQEKLTLEQQMQVLIEGQNKIEKRLTNIENIQRVLIRGMGAGVKPPQAARGAKGGGCGPVKRTGRKAIDYNKVYDIQVGKSPIQGKKGAKITIVEFSEIQCPYSKRFHPVVREVLKAYPNDVNHIFKHFPLGFHPQARPGSKAILAAGEQGKYFEMLDLLFAKGPLPRVANEKPEDLEKRLLVHYEACVKELGLNVRRFKKDYKNKDAQWEKIIEEDTALAKKIGVGGTPTFFLGGKLTRSRDLQSFKVEIDKLLEEQKNKKKK